MFSTVAMEHVVNFAALILTDWRVLRAVAIIVAAAPCVVSAQTPVQPAPPSPAPQPALPSADFQESQFFGCWKHAGVRLVANQWTGYSILCFRNDRTVYYSYASREHGGEDEFEWQFIPKDKLVIDEQTCGIIPGTTAEHLFLARCLYMGAWVRQCARMNNEGTGCPRDQ
jgi:hypothetical protein